MLASEVQIGMTATAKVGNRYAEVTVLREARSATRVRRWVCLTADTRREITATAARLHGLPGSPAARSADAREQARRDELGRQQQEWRRQQREWQGRTVDAGLLAEVAAVVGYTAAEIGESLDRWLDTLPGVGARLDAVASITRALRANPRLAAVHGWGDIARDGHQQSLGGPFSRPACHPAGGLSHLNRERLVELPLGDNARALTRIVARCHVAEGLLTVARAVRRAMGTLALRRLPVPVRRGIWQHCAMQHAANRALYREVTGHEPLPTERMVAEAVGVACGLGPMPR